MRAKNRIGLYIRQHDQLQVHFCIQNEQSNMDNSEILANDVVNRVCFPGNMEDDCVVSVLSDQMQKLVEFGLKKFEPVFRELVPRLDTKNATGIFQRCVEKLFKEDDLHWGRIICVYVLGAAIAKRLQERCTDEDAFHFTRRLFMPTMYKRVRPWVAQHGGWKKFSRVFASKSVYLCKDPDVTLWDTPDTCYPEPEGFGHAEHVRAWFALHVIACGMALLAAS